MKIFISTKDFSNTNGLIELCEYVFKYGSQNHKTPSILVGEPNQNFYEKVPNDQPFIFIFDRVSKDDVKEGISALLKKYSNNNPRVYIFVIAEMFSNDMPPYRKQSFFYKDLNFTPPVSVGFSKKSFQGFNHTCFFTDENFKKGMLEKIRYIIDLYEK